MIQHFQQCAKGYKFPAVALGVFLLQARGKFSLVALVMRAVWGEVLDGIRQSTLLKSFDAANLAVDKHTGLEHVGNVHCGHPMEPFLVDVFIDVDRNVVKDHAAVFLRNYVNVRGMPTTLRLRFRIFEIVKRTLRIGLMAWYLVASTGVYLHFHYCGGVLSNIGFFGTCAHNCCDQTHDSDCCETEDIYLALEDEHRVLPGLTVPVFASVEFTPQLPPFPLEKTKTAHRCTRPDRGPPEPLYLLFGQRLTYG